MTAFYWNDTYQQSADDAAAKGLANGTWLWIDEVIKIKGVNVLDYAAIYFQAGNRDLEHEFAMIQERNAPTWLC